MGPEAARGMPGNEWSLLGTEMSTVREQGSIIHRLGGGGMEEKAGTMAHCNSISSPSELRCCLKKTKHKKLGLRYLLFFGSSQVSDSTANRGQRTRYSSRPVIVSGHLASLSPREMTSAFLSSGFPVGSSLMTPERGDSSVRRWPGLRVNGI